MRVSRIIDNSGLAVVALAAWRPVRLWLLTVLLPLLCLARAEPRIASVMANSAYVHAPPLINPANDAVLVAAALERPDFKVSLVLDADRSATISAISDFGFVNAQSCFRHGGSFVGVFERAAQTGSVYVSFSVRVPQRRSRHPDGCRACPMRRVESGLIPLPDLALLPLPPRR